MLQSAVSNCSAKAENKIMTDRYEESGSSHSVDIDELIGGSKGARLAYEQRNDVLEAASLIRRLRNSANISQRELAKRVHTTQARISQLERGNGKQGPTFELLNRIARACNNPLFVMTFEDINEVKETALENYKNEIKKQMKEKIKDALGDDTLFLRRSGRYKIIKRDKHGNQVIVARAKRGKNLTARWEISGKRKKYVNQDLYGNTRVLNRNGIVVLYNRMGRIVDIYYENLSDMSDAFLEAKEEIISEMSSS